MSKVIDNTSKTLADIIYSRIMETKQTNKDQIIKLASGNHAIFIKNFYPFNISMILLYNQDGEPICLSSDYIIHSVGIRYSDNNKQIRKMVKEIVDEYENVQIEDEMTIKFWTQCIDNR